MTSFDSYMVYEGTPQCMHRQRLNPETMNWEPVPQSKGRQFILVGLNSEEWTGAHPPYAALLALPDKDQWSREFAAHVCQLLNEHPFPDKPKSQAHR